MNDEIKSVLFEDVIVPPRPTQPAVSNPIVRLARPGEIVPLRARVMLPEVVGNLPPQARAPEVALRPKRP